MLLNYCSYIYIMAKDRKTELPPDHIDRLKAIGEKITALRKETGLSYEQFAINNNIHRITYYNLEKGNNFNMSTLLKVLDAHQISLAEFFDDLQ